MKHNDTVFVATLLGESKDQILNNLCTPTEIGEIKVIVSDASGTLKMNYELNGEPVSEETLKNELFRLFKLNCKEQIARNNQQIEKYRTGYFENIFTFKKEGVQ